MYTLCNTMGPQTNIHHLSANIPNYCLAECHDQYQDLFSSVTRVRLGEVRDALKCILWDTRAHRIISVAEYGKLTTQFAQTPQR